VPATFPITVSAGVTNGTTPYEDGNNRYLVTQNKGVSPNTLTVFKSTDFGQTWTEMDAAHAKAISTDFPLKTNWSTTQDTAGRKIYCVYWDGSRNLILSTFNTATDTWVSGNITSAINAPLGTGAHFIASVSCIFRPGTGDVLAVFTNSTVTIGVFGTFGRTQFAICNLSVWSATTLCGLISATSADLYDWFPMNIVPGASGAVNVFYQAWSEAAPLSSFPELLEQQAIHSGGSLGALQLIDSYISQQEIVPAFFISVVSSGGTIQLAYASLDSIIGAQSSTKITYSIGQAGDNISFTTTTIVVSAGSPNFLVAGGVSVAFRSSNSTAYVFWVIQNQNTNVFTFSFQRTLSGVTTSGDVGTSTVPSVTGLTSNIFVSNSGAYAIAFPGTQYYWEQAGIAPPPAATPQASTVGGGSYFPRFLNKSHLLESIARIYNIVTLRDFPPISSFFLFPNVNDLCLAREFHMYQLIDREYLSCAKKPECFLQNERDWLDSPPGWRPFNPVGAIPLPAPGAGDVDVFKFRVPYGYDGVITAQYHGYTQNFTQGSGDILFRVKADGRYLRDEGNISMSIGNPKNLSPVSGGLQLRSGNLVEYVVNAPNTSGLLPPPGTGFILAGLHGFFYPRQ